MKHLLTATAVLATTVALAFLGGCSTVDDPHTRMQNRVTQAAVAGKKMVVDSLSESDNCPRGMVAMSDRARIESEVDYRYREDHGRSGGGRSVNNGPNNFRPYGSADVQVKVEVEASGRRRLECVSPAEAAALAQRQASQRSRRSQ